MPDRIWIATGTSMLVSHDIAQYAVSLARMRGPKMSGDAMRHLQAIYGEGWAGIHFPDEYVWFQEMGIRPFTMFALAGKTIPMWVDDPTGSVRRENKNAKTRRTESGKTQVLIFRKAAKQGARKQVRRRIGGTWTTVDVPASYPGAPGRISHRVPGGGPAGGRIHSIRATPHVGVRWRYPGIHGRLFLHHSLAEALLNYGIPVTQIHAGERNPTIRR